MCWFYPISCGNSCVIIKEQNDNLIICTPKTCSGYSLILYSS